VRYLNDYANAEYTGTGGDWHIASLRARAVSYTLDGMTAKTLGTNTFQDTDNILLPNAEAIQEVAVSTSGMSAEYGHTAGGRWPPSSNRGRMSFAAPSMSDTFGKGLFTATI
jgi:hypothetical protein